MFTPEQEELLKRNLSIDGDGNIIGNDNTVHVTKQTAGDYAVQIGEQHLNLTEQTLIRILTIQHSQVGVAGDHAHIDGGVNFNVGVLNLNQPTPEMPVPYQLLNPPEPFIDRKAIRTTLAEQLNKGGAYLLCGMGGVGKTALALQVAYDMVAQKAFPDGVLWVPLESQPTSETAAAWILAAYGIQEERNPLGTLAGVLHQRKPLIILDNAEAAIDTADALLACRGGATALVTSRDSNLGLNTIPGVPLDLAPLETADGIALLRARLGNACLLDDAQAKNLTELVGGLPLALTLAAGFIIRRLRRDSDPVVTYLKHLHNTPLAVLELGQRRDNSVRITFDLSWQALKSEPLARQVFGAVACAPGDSVDLVALQAVLDAGANAIEQTIWLLAGYSLIVQYDNRYSLHPLLRTYVRQKLKGENFTKITMLQTRFRHYYLDFARHADEADDYGASLDPERDNVLGAMAWAWEAKDWEQVTAFGKATAFYLQLRGFPHLQRERASWRLHAAQQLNDQQEIANALKSLGDVHLQLSEYGAARARYQEALDVYRASGARLGEANVLKSLGDVHLWLSEYEDAQARYQESLDVYRRLGHRLGEANALLHLGDVHLQISEYEDARARYQEALPVYRRLGARLGEANALQSLGDVHLMLVEYGDARARYQEALKVYRRLGDRLGEANALSSLGDVHLSLSEYGTARARYQESLPVYRRLGHRLGEANALKNLGDVHLQLSEYGDARARYQEALPVYHQLGDRLGEANVLKSLGNMYFEQQKYTAAISHYEQAMTIYHTLELTNDEANVLNRIAYLQEQRGAHKIALEAYGRALELAPNNPMWYRNRAYAFIQGKNAEAARTDLNRAVELQPDHPYLSLRWGDLAILEQNYTQAIIAYEAFISQQSHIPDGYYGLALALLASGDPKQSLASYTQALALTTKYHDVKNAIEELEMVLQWHPNLEGSNHVLNLLQEALNNLRSIE